MLNIDEGCLWAWTSTEDASCRIMLGSSEGVAHECVQAVTLVVHGVPEGMLGFILSPDARSGQPAQVMSPT